jgi:predicted RNA binding protein YcfA (HicA-like mRNA interferase family)
MPKLRVLSASEVCKILQKHGFVRVRQTGSHIIMRGNFPTEESLSRYLIIPSWPEAR